VADFNLIKLGLVALAPLQARKAQQLSLRIESDSACTSEVFGGKKTEARLVALPFSNFILLGFH